MNTLIHIIGLAAVLWFGWWLLDRDITMPGLAMLGMGLLLLVWTLQAAVEDMGDLKANNKRRGRR